MTCALIYNGINWFLRRILLILFVNSDSTNLFYVLLRWYRKTDSHVLSPNYCGIEIKFFEVCVKET